MLSKLKKSNNEGFTIIEVMIVLAIAGLILLIVFLAVPALQRNGRNTTKRSDASKVLGAVGEFLSNNDGKVPVTVADLASISTSANLSTGNALTASIPVKQANVTTMTVNQLEIVTSVTCTGTHATSLVGADPTVADFKGEVTDGNARSYVVLYSVEAAGNKQITQCAGS